MSITRTELISYIRETLGDPVVDVELETSQIERGINQALRIWNRRNPVEKFLRVQVTTGIQDYDLSGVTDLRGVLNVCPEPLDSDIFDAIEFDIFRDRVWAIPALDVSDIAIEDVFLQDLRYVSSTMFEWLFNEDTKLLWLSPKPSRDYGLFVIYTKDANVEEATRQYDWVIDYALAHTKMVLGHVRRKHGNKIPGKELDIELDGGDLINEGKEEMRELKEKLENMGPDWTPPIVA
jgi:hypothetical protein